MTCALHKASPCEASTAHGSFTSPATGSVPAGIDSGRQASFRAGIWGRTSLGRATRPLSTPEQKADDGGSATGCQCAHEEILGGAAKGQSREEIASGAIAADRQLCAASTDRRSLDDARGFQDDRKPHVVTTDHRVPTDYSERCSRCGCEPPAAKGDLRTTDPFLRFRPRFEAELDGAVGRKPSQLRRRVAARQYPARGQLLLQSFDVFNRDARRRARGSVTSTRRSMTCTRMFTAGASVAPHLLS